MVSTARRGATQEAPPRPPPDTVVDIPGLPGIGQLLALRRDRLTVQRRLAETADLTRFRVGRRTLVAASSAAWAGAVLVDHADDFVKSAPLAIYGRPLLGDGLLTSEHERHRRQRKL